jgi:acetyl esterase/lipase
MKRLLLLIALFGWVSAATAQICDNNRYKNYIFSSATRTDDVVYGRSTQTNPSQLIALQMDIYRPDGDAETSRPLLIVIHGGTFISGTRRDAGIAALSDSFARKGFVVASISYRLQWNGFPNPFTSFIKDSITAAAARATQDVRTCLRYFYKTAQNGNPWGVDTSNIFIIGESAGAIAGMHSQYLKSLAQFHQLRDSNIVKRNDGLFGDGGPDTANSIGYSTKAKAVFSICGAIGRQAWLEPNDPPVFSLHAVDDQTVLYRSGQPGAISTFQGPTLSLDGSFVVDSAARAIGLHSRLLTWPTGGHVPYQNVSNATQIEYMRQTVDFITQHLYDGICQNFTGSDPRYNQLQVEVAPNPVRNQFRVTLPEATAATLRLFDAQGREVFSQQLQGTTQAEIQRPQLPAGVYFLSLTQGGRSFRQSLLLD